MRYTRLMAPALILLVAACDPAVQNTTHADSAHDAELAATREAQKIQYRGPRGEEF